LHTEQNEGWDIKIPLFKVIIPSPFSHGRLERETISLIYVVIKNAKIFLQTQKRKRGKCELFLAHPLSCLFSWCQTLKLEWDSSQAQGCFIMLMKWWFCPSVPLLYSTSPPCVWNFWSIQLFMWLACTLFCSKNALIFLKV